MRGTERQPIFILIVGTNGTGKSTLILNRFIRNSKRKTLIVDPDGMEQVWDQFPSIDSSEVAKPPYRITKILFEGQETIESFRDFTNGQLILDDCRYYIRGNIEGSIRQLFIRRKQLCQDQIASAHGLSEVPATFWTFATHLILFKTTDSYLRQSAKDKIPRAKLEEIQKAVEFLNNQSDIHKCLVISLR